MSVLRHFHIIHFHIPGNTSRSCGDFLIRKMHGGLRDDMADTVTDENLHGNAGIAFFLICQVYERTGDSVSDLVRVRGVHFLKHHAFPFLAFSNRSITSSWGVAPPYSLEQFSLTIW